MKPGLTTGVEAEVTNQVRDNQVIHFLGRDVIPALSTPGMIWEMEAAARKALEPYLDENENSVGTKIEVAHLAPTPIRMQVTARARVTAVDGRKVVFAVEAYDAKEKIGEGTHERYVIDVGRFSGRLATKRAEAATDDRP